MRILVPVMALALLVAAPPARPATDRPLTSPARVISPVPSSCASSGTFAQGERQRPRMRRLGELPPGQAYMAVYRTDDKGCLDPMLASERQGIRRPR